MKSQADRERVWREISDRLRSAPQEFGSRVVVLAAHPDDETIGASCVLSRVPNCAVAFLTDGAPRDSKLWSSGINCTREEYASIRRREATAALSLAGISQEAMFWLGAIDQEAVLETDRLAGDLRRILDRVRPEVVITHPYEGGHPDHDAAAFVARIATSLMKHPPALLEMTSYHLRDGRCVTGEFLNPEASFQLSLELSVSDRERKRRMMDAYESQRLVLENFPVERESLRLAPEYDFSKPPHEGKLWYECMGWMTGSRWRELAATSMDKTQEQTCR